MEKPPLGHAAVLPLFFDAAAKDSDFSVGVLWCACSYSERIPDLRSPKIGYAKD
jgi:hypothetical protein